MASKRTKKTNKKSTLLPKELMDTKFLTNLALVILVGTAVFLLAQKYRGQFIAGVVNKTPITRYQLNQLLVDRYGEAILEELINNEILVQQAEAKNITVSDEDIESELSLLKDQLGGDEGLDMALAQYGLTLDELKSQIKLRIYQDKLSDQVVNVVITDEQVQDYYDQNSDTIYKDTPFEDASSQIRTSLEEQEKQQQFFAWFDQIKSETQIENYLN